MKIRSVEPTPSPNVMKLNVDETLPPGERRTYTLEQMAEVPEPYRTLLAIPGVKSLFRTADFLSVERKAKADWETILARVTEVLGTVQEGVTEGDGRSRGAETFAAEPGGTAGVTTGVGAVEGTRPGTGGTDERWREIQVQVQMLHGIPTQVKLISGQEVRRVAMPELYMLAAMEAQRAVGGNAILHRRWDDQGVRYGSFEEVGEQVVQELLAAYDEERVRQLVAQAGKAADEDAAADAPVSEAEALAALSHPDWQKRYAALQRMELDEVKLPVLVAAMKDDHPSIRRLAVAYLGALGTEAALPYLLEALRDPSVAIRRTAGDALSDLGSPKAMAAMCEALSDPNKLVRWRAARYLYEVGDETALPALRKAENDPEFEVRMQVKMAIERIERGEAASGTVWQQMTRARKTAGASPGTDRQDQQDRQAGNEEM